ncbi:hypothetical protein GCM10011386_42930 [Parapedobacter defluvii]|uniref:HTH cro/C1-type domain-containing protein n=1 Tax=Parapedobacter defluvii TaxID=2045106 RepID=A0ABQ1MTC2_9SPHI|nr:hypothetical protein [Parapedobacter defluvii]GGC46059.1 hypothetical protein GCM10011386_42930 [Parapedobacter defluvii]
MTVIEELAKILKRYMKKFGLGPIDIAFLSKVNKKTIEAVLAGTGGIELDSVDEISLIFGLRYFEFGNPDFEMPSFDSLPEKTKARIAFRKKEGPHEETSYDQRLLNEKIIVVLAEYNQDGEFLAEHIVTKLLETFKEEVSTSEVTTRLNNPLNEYVIQTDKKDTKKEGKGRKPYYFQLIKKIPIKALAEAERRLRKVKNEQP